MSHRVGICSSCEANYKIPADFAADKAKCKSCGGIVEIGDVVDDPPPVPAKPVRKAEPKLEEHVPSGKHGDGPSMMEQLRAQRQAEQEGESAAQPAAAPESAASPSDETISSTGPVKTRASSRKAAPSRSRRRGRRDDEEEDGDEEQSGRRTRRKEKSPLPLICTVLLFIGILAGGGFYLLQGADDEAVLIVEEEIAKAGDGSLIEADTTPTPEDSAEEPPAEEEEPMEEVEEKPKPTSNPKVKDPMEVDLAGLSDFGPAPECDADRWESLLEDAALLVDPQAGASGGRAGKRLIDSGRLAIPALINVFKTRDMSSDAGYRDGDVLQRTLEKIYNGKNFGWKYSTEPNDHWYNRKVVENHWKLWDKYQDDEAGWLKFTGLDKEGVKPSSGGGGDDLSTDELDALDDI